MNVYPDQEFEDTMLFQYKKFRIYIGTAICMFLVIALVLPDRYVYAAADDTSETAKTQEETSEETNRADDTLGQTGNADTADETISETEGANLADWTLGKNTENGVNETNEEDEDEEEDADSKYSFSDKSRTLYVGWEDYLCEVFGTGENATITYRSKNENVATVSEDGIISPVSAGKTKVYADITENGKTSKCSMKITVEEPHSILKDHAEAMTCDGTYIFSLERIGHNEPVTWTLSGEGLAEIEAVSATDCAVHTLNPGFIWVTAECRGETFSSYIRIYPGKGELFIISPSSDPYKGYYKSYSTYNKKTKGYYLLRSYLERLDTLKGGVLVLTCGTYKVTNTLCIPSDTTIFLEDGATILKTDDTGTKSLTATGSLFHTVSYTNAAKAGVFSGYNGEHDIQILGEGAATIDLNHIKCQGIAAAHCSNLTVKGIAFKNMNTYHFIELAGNKDVTITGNFFYGHSESSTTRKEAINVDCPDKETNGFNQYWTSYDRTPNENVLISDNIFYNVECGVGTHRYSGGSPHKNLNITGNTFIDCGTYCIRGMNWDYPVIKNNVFQYSVPSDYSEIAIIMNGSKDPIITENLFENLNTPISFYHWKNSGSGSIYDPVYNELSETCMALLRKNYLVNVTSPYFEYYKYFNDFSDESLELHLIDGGE